MELRVLGAIKAVENGIDIDISSRQQRRLLCLLALASGEMVTEDRIVDSLWDGDGRPEDPRSTVRTYISRLRNLLGAEAITSHASGYSLSRDVEVDVDIASRGLDTARDLSADGDAEAAIETLRGALALWSGPTLGEVADELWAAPEVQRLDAIRSSLREHLGEALIEAGEFDAAVAELEVLVAAGELQENAWRQLMLAHHGAGRQPEALRTFQAYREQLGTQTGLEPSPEMIQLEQRILDWDPAVTPPSRPRRLAGYELGELVGEGAFGAIYQAEQPAIGREVAIKVVHPQLANRPEFVRRFEIEAQTIARLEHPHIVPLYDYWRDPSGAYLVMRYLRGGTAEQALVRSGPFSVEATTKIVEEVGGALAMAHEGGIVHRDVKPSNVLFDESGNSYLADFGIATAAGEASGELGSAGSPLYAAPEQIRDGTSSPATDIYSLGVLVYELLTGAMPFADSASLEQLLQRKLAERVPQLRASRADISDSLELVLQTALDADPQRRFPSMAEFILAFRSASAESHATSTATSAEVRPREAAGHTLVSVQLEGVNPYKGLAAFDEPDVEDFFGREALAEELAQHLHRSRFLVVTGPSGSGKSSVVRAGLLPSTRQGGAFVASMLPGAHPFDELETVLLRLATQPVGALMDQLTADDRGLGRAVKRILPPDAQLLLVIDQFEELFTLTTAEERDQFLRGLAAAVTDPRGAVTVVATLRADFYDRPLQHGDISELVRANTIAVAPMDPGELEAAITRPAARFGVSVDPALVAELVSEVRGNAASLPLLQYVLTELYERRARGSMTIEAYREIGGLTGALAQRADALHDGLAENERDDARRLFTRLISPGEGTEDTRRRVLRTELTGVGDAVIDAYGSARLLTFDHDPSTREPTVEIAHEAIIREWPRLRGWLDDDRDGLRLLRHLHTSATDWVAAGRPDSELYRGGRLEAVTDWAEDHRDDLTELEQDFLRASVDQQVAEERQEQQRISRLRMLVSASAVIAALALLAGAIALQQRRSATREADAAEIAQQSAEINADLARTRATEAGEAQASAASSSYQAETRRLASEAGFRVQSNRQLGLLLAAHAWKRDPGPESLGALQRALTSIGTFRGVLLAGVPLSDVRWLDDDRLVVGGPVGVFVVAASTGELLTSFDTPVRVDVIDPGDAAFVTKGFLRAESDVVAHVSAEDARRVHLQGVGARSELSHVLDHEQPVAGLEVSHDGTMLATIDDLDVLRLYDTTSGSLRWAVPAHPESTFGQLGLDASYQPVANYLLTEDGLPSLAEDEVRRSRTSVEMVRHHIVFSEDDREIITQEALLRKWRSEDGSQIGGDAAVWRDRAIGRGSTPIVNRVLSFVADSHDGETLVYDEGGLALIDATGSVVAQSEIDSGGDAFGLPKVNTVRWAGGDTAQVLMSDGRLLAVQIDDGSIVGDAIDSQIVAASDVALSPSGKLAAISSAEGVGLFSLDGTRAIARAIERNGTTGGGITDDGRYLTQSYADLASFLLPKYIHNLETGETREVIRPNIYGIIAGIATAGKLGAVTSSYDMVLLDPDTLERVSPVFDAPGAWNGQAFDNDRTMAALASLDGIRVFDFETGELIAVLRGLSGLAPSLSFSPDGGRLAAADVLGRAMVWSTEEWEVLDAEVGERTASVSALTYSPKGEWLVTMNQAGDIALRDPLSNEVVHELAGNAELEIADSTMYFFEDSRYLVTAADGSPQMWDLVELEAVGDPFPNDPDNRVEGSADLPVVVTAVGDYRLIWDLDVVLWPAIACQLAGRNLTLTEWERFGPEEEDYQATCDQWANAQETTVLGPAAFSGQVELPSVAAEPSELELITNRITLEAIAAIDDSDPDGTKIRCQALLDELRAAAADPELLRDSGIDDNPFHSFYTVESALEQCAGGSIDAGLRYLIDARDNPLGACAGYPSPCPRGRRDP